MQTERPLIERWFFYQDAVGLWKWARLDVVGTILGHSGSSFASRDECLENARQSGYGDDRRGELGLALPQDCASHAAKLSRENLY